MKNFKPFSILEEDEGFILLELKQINSRTLICWYNPNYGDISVNLFSNEQPNALSRRTTLSEWGYATKMITNLATPAEAAEVVSLYLQDMEKNNFWWEIDELH